MELFERITEAYLGKCGLQGLAVPFSIIPVQHLDLVPSSSEPMGRRICQCAQHSEPVGYRADANLLSTAVGVFFLSPSLPGYFLLALCILGLLFDRS